MSTEQGEVYAEFIAVELQHERQRRERLDARATATVVTSGALVTLATTLGILDPVSIRTQPAVLRSTFVVATALIMVSVVVALVGGWLHGYEVLGSAGLRRMVTSSWKEGSVTARSRVAQFNVMTLDALREGNNRKARKLLAAHVLQVVGIAGLVIVAVWGATTSTQ